MKSLRDSPERFLATVQIGMTIAGTTAAAFGGARMEQGLEPMYASLGFVRSADPAMRLLLTA